jgi:hypothetical protein
VYPAQTLTDTLCKELGKDDLKLNAKVLTLAYSHDGSSPSQNWSITCASNKKTQDVDAVIITVSIVFFLLPHCFFPEYLTNNDFPEFGLNNIICIHLE